MDCAEPRHRMLDGSAGATLARISHGNGLDRRAHGIHPPRTNVLMAIMLSASGFLSDCAGLRSRKRAACFASAVAGASRDNDLDRRVRGIRLLRTSGPMARAPLASECLSGSAERRSRRRGVSVGADLARISHGSGLGPLARGSRPLRTSAQKATTPLALESLSDIVERQYRIQGVSLTSSYPGPLDGKVLGRHGAPNHPPRTNVLTAIPPSVAGRLLEIEKNEHRNQMVLACC